jgi:hypothetical protein
MSSYTSNDYVGNDNDNRNRGSRVEGSPGNSYGGGGKFLPTTSIVHLADS